MTYTFDYFVGQLTCFKCGSVSKADGSTGMQTKICEKRNLIDYGAGDFLPCDYAHLRGNGYITINNPGSTKSYSLLDFWNCPNCHAAFNCARIVVESEIIVSVESIDLDVEAINSCNYISEDCGYLGWRVKDGQATKTDI